MKLLTAMVCVPTFFVGRLGAQDGPATPDRPPRFVVVAKVDRDSPTIVYRDHVADADSLAALFGKLKDQKQPDPDAVLKLLGDDLGVPRELSFVLRTGKVYTADGTEIPPGEAVKRMSVGSVAVLSTTGKNVPAAYRKVLQKDAIILVPPLVKDVPALPPRPKREPMR